MVVVLCLLRCCQCVLVDVCTFIYWFVDVCTRCVFEVCVRDVCLRCVFEVCVRDVCLRCVYEVYVRGVCTRCVFEVCVGMLVGWGCGGKAGREH